MIWTPNAVMSSPVRTSLANPSQIWGRSSMAAAAMSAFVGIGPPGGGGDEQQGAEADRERDRTGQQQRDLGADRSDEHAGERQRAELGAVAGGVVEREGAATERLRHALVDQRPHQYVLDAVADAAEREPGERGGQRAGGGAGQPDALNGDAPPGGDRQPV